MAARRLILSVLFALSVINILTPANASTPRYVLQQQKRKEDVVLRLLDNKRHAIVWKCTFQSVYPPAFSQDHRALAMEVRGKDLPSWALLLWQEGKPVRLLYKQDFFQENDGIMDLAWSADKQRLLLLTWAGGGSLDARNGEIWYLKVPHAHFGFGLKGISRMKWVGARYVRYWKVAHSPDFPPPAERVSHGWTCP